MASAISAGSTFAGRLKDSVAIDEKHPKIRISNHQESGWKGMRHNIFFRIIRIKNKHKVMLLILISLCQRHYIFQSPGSAEERSVTLGNVIYVK